MNTKLRLLRSSSPRSALVLGLLLSSIPGRGLAQPVEPATAAPLDAEPAPAPAPPPAAPAPVPPPVLAAEAPAADSAPTPSEAALGTVPRQPERETELQDVVVTAQRIETSLQKTPIAISVFEPKELQTRAAFSIRDLAGQAPNLFIARTTLSHTTQGYSLRGIGETDPIQEPVVAVYVDDVYQPRQLGSHFDFNDVERIEVLRGPQGTLYGRNSSAGAIRVITTDPGNEFRTLNSLTCGNYNTVRALTSISGPLVKDRLAASVAFVHHRRDGVTYNPTQKIDVNRINVDALRIKLRWTPTPKWDIQPTLSGMVDRSDTRGYVPAVQPDGTFDKRETFSEVPPHQRLDQGSASLRIIHRPTEGIELKSISALSGFDLDPVWYDNDGQAALIQKNLIHYADRDFTQEIQLNGTYKTLTFASGVFYLYEHFFVERDGYSRRNAQQTDPVLNPENYNFARAHNTTRTDSFAIFGELNWKPFGWLTLTGGVRETIEKKRFHFNNKRLNLNGEVVDQAIRGGKTETWTALTPKAGISLQYTDNVLHYFTYSRGFKSGGFDNRATLVELAERPFNPEFVNTYETGIKADLLERHLRVNLVGFYNDYRDLQVSYRDPAYPGSSIRGNAGKAHTAGAEIEANARLPFGLSLNFSGGYLHAVYDEYKNAGGVGVNADGNVLANAPKWNYSLGGAYDLPIETSIRIAANVQWASGYYGSALNAPQERSPAQSFVNGSLSWTSADGHFGASAAVRNLFNSSKPSSISYTPATGVHLFNFPDPRTVLFTLKYEI